jgi:phage terminase large subunit GpA-like protein
LYGFLRQGGPGEGEEEPYGFCHFPQYGEEYFKQLTSEELMVKIVKGYRRYEWQKRYERNEALDCRVYARVAASVCGLDRFEETQWERLEKELGIIKTPPTSESLTTLSNKPTVSKIQRRRSTFWN